jgi:septal ring factor EnvC (AmiA/AmiB activator)
MKRLLYLTAALAIFGAAFCWLCLPRAIAQSPAKDPAAAAQSTAASQQDVERYNQLVRAQEDRTRRVETLLVRQEQLMDKQEAAFVRFQKILDTWEQQQKQYQQYLDSLKK